ncbi:hypothetical protein mru_0786 [Methanobrevibacter ruminantium M1]|uniref:Uncharacterized protein n=1 Tax=Methanobrevibacter ruminantium (strain ATCC 35063 / DSM 1093 / JCM 13430 / OCM 146 / M1) TaxID=634498 RepID=D3E276_METRM|nr:HEPN domain-containing protein [Methanobrevibacter ruminantium]ADC46637.1 hypothetical protein mru_0786 [Methanobrevibacter ruminantium M1]
MVNYGDDSLENPDDITLPFFAYGIFKPGEIAYSNIKKYIGKKNEKTINYAMKQRDGVPILLPEENNGKTHGYIFKFNDNERAYDTINHNLSNKLYEWGTIEQGKINVLFGKDPDIGSDDIGPDFDRENYKGKDDPFFKEALAIKQYVESNDFTSKDDFYDLQRYYILLWSAIERCCKLKYNKESDGKNREEFSKEKEFIDALDKCDETNYREIYKTDDLTPRKFDTDEPKWCINYYYTLRCNIVHRGKSNVNRDMGLLLQATKDLLNIFEHILDETFKEE